MVVIRRREFFTLLAGAAASPLAARAQQRPKMPVVGFLSATPPGFSGLAPFRQGLAEAGYVEGRNVAIEYRFAENEFDRLPGLAADLVRLRVAVIAAPGSAAAAVAAKTATTAIPIVFGIPGDPVKLGLVASLNRPGGNATGFNVMNGEIGAKQIGLLHDLVPNAARFGVLLNPNSPDAEQVIADLRSAASAIGRPVEAFYAGVVRDIDPAFASMAEKRVDALLIGADPLFGNRRVQLAILAARHGVPVIHGDRAYAEAGGLMTYGSSNLERARMVGVYTGRVLGGEKPAEIPVMQATKFEFVINLSTAKALGLTVPPTLLALATEVIE
jgi:putative tryptophan/tyrosine transport system substrate-binding protein